MAVDAAEPEPAATGRLGRGGAGLGVPGHPDPDHDRAQQPDHDVAREHHVVRVRGRDPAQQRADAHAQVVADVADRVRERPLLGGSQVGDQGVGRRAEHAHPHQGDEQQQGVRPRRAVQGAQAEVADRVEHQGGDQGVPAAAQVAHRPAEQRAHQQAGRADRDQQARLGRAEALAAHQVDGEQREDEHARAVDEGRQEQHPQRER